MLAQRLMLLQDSGFLDDHHRLTRAKTEVAIYADHQILKQTATGNGILEHYSLEIESARLENVSE